MAIINNSFNFVFVHVPKAAGTSVTSVLSKYTNYCDLEIGGSSFGEQIQSIYRKRFGIGKHSTAREIRNVVGAVSWSRFFTFSFVRNPFSRCVSTYHFLRRWESPDVEFNERMRAFNSFEEYVKSGIWEQTNGPDDIFRAQVHWLRSGADPQRLLVDFIGRVESIQTDMIRVLDAIGLRKEIALLDSMPVLNRSEEKAQPGMLPQGVVERIVSRYEMDFDAFGYSKEPGAYISGSGGETQLMP